MPELKHKIVAVLNKSIEPGRLFNALGHMAIGMGGSSTAESLHLINYYDKEANTYPNISKMPFIILRANASKLKKLYSEAKELENIDVSAFTESMTVGGWQEQLERSQSTPLEQHLFFGVLLRGDISTVESLTRKFSLWR